MIKTQDREIEALLGIESEVEEALTEKKVEALAEKLLPAESPKKPQDEPGEFETGEFIETSPAVKIGPEYTEIHAFLVKSAPRSGFYKSLLDQLLKRGTLSPKQVAACEKNMKPAAPVSSWSGTIELKPFLAKKLGLKSNEIKVLAILHETPKAIQVKAEGFADVVWLPKSQLL